MLSDTFLRRLSIVLAILGLIVASYLIYIKFNPSSALCTGVGDCEAVNNSVYSWVFGIPVAALGAIAYAAILGLLLLEIRVDFFSEWAPLVVFGLSLAGVLYSAYLTYIELAVIHKICPYCVTSAVLITLILISSSVRLRHYL